MNVFFDFLTETFNYLSKLIRPISTYYFSFLDWMGLSYAQSLFLSPIVYSLLMFVTFHVRRFITGNKKTVLITEFSSEKYRPRLNNFTKFFVIFGWNMIMVH
jgi:hypothetical protein